MRRLKSLLCLLIVVLPLLAPGQAAQAGSATGWIPVGPGIDYQEWTLDDPNRVYVARMDRSNPDVMIETSLGQGRLTGKEKISAQFQRYDGALNDWYGDWGATNQVVVAINGSMLEPENLVYPDRGVVQSGWYAKRGRENQSGSGFVYKRGGEAFVGGCIKNPTTKQYFKIQSNGNTVDLTQLNRDRTADDLILYTPQWGANTGTDETGWEVLVEMDRPAAVTAGQAVTGTVRQIRKKLGSTYIPFDHVVISAGANKWNKIKNSGLQDGDVLSFVQEIGHYSESDCKTARPESWAGAYASVGGDYIFLKDGKVQPEKYNRNPLTAVALNDRYVFFIVVDGRQDASRGMTMAEIGRFARDYLGATWGVNQDGGGSSVMVVKGYVMNIPSDGVAAKPYPNGPEGALGPVPSPAPYLTAPYGTAPARAFEASDWLFMPLVSKATAGFNPPSQEGLVERYLVNGLMMVVALPKVQSQTYGDYSAIAVREDAALRLGPGTNYASLGTIAAGSTGIVLHHAGGLNGVMAKGSYWWKVQVDTPNGPVSGWMEEGKLGPR